MSVTEQSIHSFKEKLILMLLDLGYTKLSDGRQLYELSVEELKKLYCGGGKKNATSANQ
ncbi:Fur-regulated basic protein FbpA [Robertmurraya massiliosenegalensis]|uniref:Fur-regulated basic protein FbpA n=1 Tax=Robertmurraya TaxID=2837507 RepID=UPI0039A5EBAF